MIMKNLLNIIIAIVVAGGLFFGYKSLESPGSSGEKHSNTYAVVVGISDYLNGNKPYQVNNLNYCDDDAHTFYSFLRTSAGGSVPDSNMMLLIDNQASKSNILQQLDKMFAKSGPDDRVIFYFAGHGTNGSFATYDINLDNVNTSLLHKEVKEAFRKCRAKTRLCFADACKSGSMKNKETNREISSERDLPIRSFEDTESGLVVLMAARSYQSSSENPNILHGYFTKFLVDALEGKADKNADNIVTIKETYDYVYRNLVTLPKHDADDKGQVPVIFGKYNPEMALARLKVG